MYINVDICTAVNLNGVVCGIVNFLDQFYFSEIKGTIRIWMATIFT